MVQYYISHKNNGWNDREGKWEKRRKCVGGDFWLGGKYTIKGLKGYMYSTVSSNVYACSNRVGTGWGGVMIW